MDNPIQYSNLSSYLVPAVIAGASYVISKENKSRNAAIGGVGGLALLLLLNRTAEWDIGNFLDNRRRNGPAFGYTDHDSALNGLILTPNGIANPNPVLPLPVATVDQPNTVSLPGGNTLLIPPPTSWDSFGSQPFMGGTSS